MPKAAPKGQKITLDYIARHFQDENEAYLFLEKMRWPNGPVCVHCQHTKAYFLQPKGDRYTRTGHATQRRVYKCANCRKQFSVLIGTIFEGSKIPLYKWLLAIHMMCSGKNGVAAYELHRTLEITNKSAWFMCHRIRKAMEREPLAGMLMTGTVEADETYIGGRPRRKNNAPRMSMKEAARHRMDNKTPVVSLVQRGGEVRSRVMKKVTGENLGALLKENVNPRSTLMTDGLSFYQKPGKMFARHEAVDHSLGEYVRDDAHINTAEGYFSQLKRSIDGTHHHVSEQHLERYLSEFDFRYNTRKMQDGERTMLAIRMAEGKRLLYRDPLRRVIESGPGE
jgi:transposase-like protein